LRIATMSPRQTTLVDDLWKAGWNPCVTRGECRHRPCTVAQGVMCCAECSHFGKCKSRCKRTRRKR
jgi:hypothetical protein